jgi:hypothetical protein
MTKNCNTYFILYILSSKQTINTFTVVAVVKFIETGNDGKPRKYANGLNRALMLSLSEALALL